MKLKNGVTKMESIWKQTAGIPHRPYLYGEIKAEAAVIGGGLAGVLTAYFLQQRGIQTVLLEANRIGSGQTRNTTAKITSQHNLIYRRLIEEFGEDKALQYASANQQAIEAYRRVIVREHIDCEWERRPAYLYSRVEREPLEREAEAARRLGIDASFTTETTLPFPVGGAVRFERQGQFHPLKFLQAISKPLQIYENSLVTSVEGREIHTDRGRVTADHIVFACHFPFLNTPGYYFMRMHQERSYLLALRGAAQLDGMYLSIDQDGYSMRNSGDVLLLGGGSHRTGENSIGGQYEKLRHTAAEYFPGSTEIALWSAQDCMTLDGIPYIGQFSASTPHWYVATGFQKWGMSSSMVAALLLSDQICGQKNPFAEVFSPQRFQFSASAKTLMEDGLQAVKGLTREWFSLPKETLDELPAGRGGIVEYEGQKMGVYRDEQGEVFLVSPRCPHLGCQLSWNPDEKSWDCPCHGSRFDYKGRRIDNPATEGLYHE